MSPQDTSRRKMKTSTRAALIAGAAVVVAAVVGVVLPIALRGSTPQVTAQVVDTWTAHGPIGLSQFTSPTDASTKVAKGLLEGTQITIVCQDLDGRLVHDTAHAGRQTSSRVWDKEADQLWVSDIYTSLPKSAGNTADGLASCTP